jgi:hypothetical protein
MKKLLLDSPHEAILGNIDTQKWSIKMGFSKRDVDSHWTRE